MELTVAEEGGVQFVEGPPGRQLVRCVEDVGILLEACLSGGVDAALLYSENLTGKFFDLSSGEAGAILQKLRNYGIRLAVVCAPGSVRFSSRFGEMTSEEARGDQFQLFESRREAREWLSKTRLRSARRSNC